MLFLLTSWLIADARAMTCQEILDMVKVQVPSNIIVQAMKASGDTFSTSELRCLMDNQVPIEILQQARSQVSAEREEESPARVEIPRRYRINTSDRGSSRSYGDPPYMLTEARKMVRANKPYTASTLLIEALERGELYGFQAEAMHYLGESLSDLELPNLAHGYYIDGLRDGYHNGYFAYLLGKFCSVSFYLGAEEEMIWIAGQIPPEMFPAAASGTLNYFSGLWFIAADDPATATQRLLRILPSSVYYAEATYQLALLSEQAGDRRQAIVYLGDLGRLDLSELDEGFRARARLAQAKGQLALARLYNEEERKDRAVELLEGIRAGHSPEEDHAVWVNATARLCMLYTEAGDFTKIQGVLLPLERKKTAAAVFAPELMLYRANLLRRSDPEEAAIVLNALIYDSNALAQVIDGLLKDYELDRLDFWARATRASGPLPPALLARILSDNQRFSSLSRHLLSMDAEERRLVEAPESWRRDVGATLRDRLQQDREYLTHTAAYWLASDLAFWRDQLRGFAEIAERLLDQRPPGP